MMSSPLRILLVLFLSAVAMFCAYGLLATFEPGISLRWRIGYIGFGAAALIGASWLAFSPARRA